MIDADSIRAVLFLEFLLDPRPLGRHLDVHVFDADRAAVGRSQDRDDLAQGGALATEQVVDEDLTVEIGLGKTVAVVVELGVGPAFFEAERVEIGFEMTAHSVGADQVQGADRVDRCLA